MKKSRTIQLTVVAALSVARAQQAPMTPSTRQQRPLRNLATNDGMQRYWRGLHSTNPVVIARPRMASLSEASDLQRLSTPAADNATSGLAAADQLAEQS